MENGELLLKPIAFIQTDFKEKFGIPRQSGLVKDLDAFVIFTQEYRDENALRGIEGFSHLWLIWEFSKTAGHGFSPTVRPPRLGGNEKVGVFATRSPFRPNPLGLSCVELAGIKMTKTHGPVLHIKGADLLDGTPLYDIKPYIPYADCKPNATAGFTVNHQDYTLEVLVDQQLLAMVPAEKQQALLGVLAEDPRPSYQEDPQRIYGMAFAGFEIKFKVCGRKLTVTEIIKQ